jgi:UDP:flavonoid glycosyltransferase YjiC (YdhE family)
MLLVPFAFDQPDNAARIARLGVGRMIARRHYRAARVAGELRALLDDRRYAERAERIGEAVRAEDGAATAARMLEETFLSAKSDRSCHV